MRSQIFSFPFDPEKLKEILILFAHPRLEHSRINSELIKAASQVEGVYVHDLYEQYPDFNIDIVKEQELLFGYEVVIWQHPFYWYSCPPLMKQWIDLVLEYNWAYGPHAVALKGKTILNAITAGGSREVYCTEGRNNYTVTEFLRPFEQTAHLCGMNYLPPFAVMGTHRISDEGIKAASQQYVRLLKALRADDVDAKAKDKCTFINDLEFVKGANHD